MSDKKSAARRARTRRAKFNRKIFASPEAEREVARATEFLGISPNELLAVATPTAKDGRRFRAADIREAAASIHQAQRKRERVPEEVDPALAASQKTADAALGEFEVPQPVLICEECGSDLAVGPHADDCPVLAEELEEAGGQPGLWTRFTGWVRRQSRPSWLRRPSLQMPQVRVPDGARNTWSRFDRWLTAEGDSRQQAVRLGGTLAVVLLMVVIVGLAGLGLAIRGGVAMVPSPAAAPTQVAAAMPTFTPVPPPAGSTVTVIPLGTPAPAPVPDVFQRIAEVQTLKGEKAALQEQLVEKTARVVELEAQLAEAATQPPSPPPAPTTAADHTVTVKSGDTVWGLLTEALGQAPTWDQIQKVVDANNLTDRGVNAAGIWIVIIQPGQVIDLGPALTG